MYEYINKNETRLQVLLIVESDENYAIQRSLFGGTHKLPPRCKFVARYEYACCIVTVAAWQGVVCHPALAHKVADHYVDTLINVMGTGNSYVDPSYFS